MNTKILAVALAAMLTVVGGAAAVTGTATTAETDASAQGADVTTAYDNGTVTVTVEHAGVPVENAAVEVGDEEYVTDENGTVVAEDVSVDDEFEVEIEGDGLEAELGYEVSDDGSLTLVEEEYEYGDEVEEEDEDDSDEDEQEESEEEEDEGEDDEGDDAEDENDEDDEDAEEDDDEAEDAEDDEDDD